MITLFTFGPSFGNPDASPFVTRAHLLLKMAGLDYKTDTSGFNKAPKGKLPYIIDDGKTIADSTFIRLHIEDKYGFDFDGGLDERQRGTAWAVDKMLEDNLYWVLVNERWNIDENFNRGPVKFFDAAPAIIRPLIIKMVRKKVKRNSYGQGTSRHERAEVITLARRSIKALADIMGGNDYLMGATPCGADAMTYAMLASLSAKHFDSPMIDIIDGHANLAGYRERMTKQYFPELS